VSRDVQRTFSVAVPVERVWHAMTDPGALNEWYFPFRIEADGSTRTEILGAERTSEVVELDPPHRLRTRTTDRGDVHWPRLPPHTREMTIVLEASTSGTRVTITHSGFGDGEEWDQVLGATSRGIDESIADLVCYLTTGVGVRRHPQTGAGFHGIGARDTPAGLEVISVQPNTFAAQLGLEPGDLLVELNGAAVFGFSELNFFNREHNPGDHLDAAWVREGKLLRGTAELGARLPVA
jgi:uncharacterized protein YndB with AHSA1/START domain